MENYPNSYYFNSINRPLTKHETLKGDYNCDVCVIGGGFSGLSTALEAARLGCKVFHGPNISNFSEIYDFLKSLNFATQVESTEELSRFLLEEFNNESTNIEENIKKIEVYGHEILNNVIREIKSFV